jgi:cytidyltransferase-like protein
MLKGLQASKKEITNFIRKTKGKKIVLCHGAFDIVHPGHLNHLENAKKLGDILVVTITADYFLKKHLHSPLYNQNERLSFLKKFKIIDYVYISNSNSAVDSLYSLKPHYFCKGTEYKKHDFIGNLNIEKKAAKNINCKIVYLGSNVKSSSKIFAENFFEIKDNELKNEILKNKKYNLVELFKKISKLKILIIGETIIDKYSYLDLKGISPKSGILSYVKNKEDYMSGGALASFIFLKSFIKNVKFISLASKNQPNKNIRELLKIHNLIKSRDFQDIVKERLMDVIHDNKIKKLITVNEYKDQNLTHKNEKKILNQINKHAPKSDLIIAQDFGHNLFSEKIIRKLEKFKNKLSINVQTNSLNFGYNIIKKFKKTNIFSLDERELKLSSSKKIINFETEMIKLTKTLNAKHGYLTLGGKYSLITNGKNCIKISTLNKNPVDTMGAGDVFHIVSSVASTVSNNMFINLFLSQIAGAHAVSILGNSTHPSINQVIRTYNFYLQSIVNQKNT